MKKILEADLGDLRYGAEKHKSVVTRFLTYFVCGVEMDTGVMHSYYLAGNVRVRDGLAELQLLA